MLRSSCGVYPIVEYYPVHNRIDIDPYSRCELLDQEPCEHPTIQLVWAGSAWGLRGSSSVEVHPHAVHGVWGWSV